MKDGCDHVLVDPRMRSFAVRLSIASRCPGITAQMACAKTQISPSISTRFHPSSPLRKNFPFRVSPKSHPYFPPSRPHLEGRIAIVTDVGYGMRWTQTARLTSALPRGRRSRVVLTPRRWRQVLEKQTSQGRRWQESPVTEEITKETVKTIAQGRPDCSGEPVVTMLVWFPSFPREAAGATGTRLSLRPRFRGERTDARLGRDGAAGRRMRGCNLAV